MTGWTFLGVLVLAVAAYLLFSGYLSTWLQYRGVRVITRPDNHRPAAVQVDAAQAAKWAAIAGERDVHLRSCSRWPEKAGCEQACLSEIDRSPEACLLQTIVTQWYEGKTCAFCAHPVESIVWHERPPALRSPGGETREWKEFRPEELPVVFATHQPVCWPCHVRESFRRTHGELVVERRYQPVVKPTLLASRAVY